MNKDIKNLRENILSALPLSMAKEYERMNQELNTDKEGYYYKKIKPIFDKVFGKDDKGKPIYRKYINVDNMKVDEEIYNFLKDNGYSITEEEFNAGIIIKNKDDKNNHLSLEELQKKGMVLRIGRILNKKKAPQKLILKWDKIAKQISNKKLIVISRHPYDIAGQSTDRSWESCMTLETDKQSAGCNSRYVDSGIKAGVLVAYLININDTNINKPLARVLIKPLIKEIDRKAYFIVSKVYGVAGNEFKKSVEKWVDKNLNKRLKGGKYYLDGDIYDDGDLDEQLILNKYILNNYTQDELYDEFDIVYDKENNIIYYSHNKPIIKNIKIEKANIYKIKNHLGFYDEKTKNLYIQKSSFDKKSVFFYNDIIIPYKKTKNLLYIIKDINYYKTFKHIDINTDNKIIYIPKIYKNNNYKGFDFTNSFTIQYTDKFIANNDNIKELVNDLSISLKYIDVSNVTDMSDLFNESERTDYIGIEDWNVSNVLYMDYLFSNNKYFNGDISNWNVSNVEDMRYMFMNSEFNGDISKWNVSNVLYMDYLFYNNKYFNGDISNWNVSNVEDMEGMFRNSNFNGNISKWNTKNVIDMEYMFMNSTFNGDISKWNVRKVEFMNNMFDNSPLENNPPHWYKE